MPDSEPEPQEDSGLLQPHGMTLIALSADTVLLSIPLPGAEIPQGALTPSEEAIVLAVFEGTSNRDIASARGTSVKTVANQLLQLYAKLGVNSRAELVLRLRGRSAP